MKNNYTLYPSKKIQPYDGMSITAGVWSEAHRYHTQLQKAHQVYLHGAGIVSGLEVVASDPADSVIYILPGVAIDTEGQMIVLAEPLAYDLGNKMEGKLHLLLLHREVKSQSAPDEENNAPAYVQDEYVIIARPDLLDVAYVELARIDRQDPKAPIQDAANPYAPQPNSIDLRFRQNVCPPPVEQALTGVCYLPGPGQSAAGLIHLARTLASQSPYRLIVEEGISLDASIFNYRLIYLLANKTAILEPEQAEKLRAFLEDGGRLLLEFSEPIEEADAVNFLKPAGIPLEKVTPSHPVFQAPSLFYTLPQGSLTGSQPVVWSWGTAVLCTNACYGSLWSGQAAPEALSRSAVRDALEWGANLVHYLLSRG